MHYLNFLPNSVITRVLPRVAEADTSAISDNAREKIADSGVDVAEVRDSASSGSGSAKQKAGKAAAKKKIKKSKKGKKGQ